ncbi:MAG TPA: Clp protease N-terminal domain-containing protein [Planctomycetota bacterium]
MSLMRQEALRLGAEEMGLDHLLLGLLGQEDGIAAVTFKNHGVDIATLKQQVAARAPAPPNESDKARRPFSSDPQNLRLSEAVRRAVNLASEATAATGARGIDSGHLLMGWSQAERLAGNALNLDLDGLRDKALDIRGKTVFTPHRPKPVNCAHSNIERLHDGFALVCRECRRVWVAVQEDHPFDLDEEPLEA